MITPAHASSALGWMSIACWVIVYSPQIHENYILKSGEGLSVLFIAIWLLGDLANLAGAMLASLLPTMIYLAAYYTLCDLILLYQIYYYRWKHPIHPYVALPSVVVSHPDANEASSLLGQTAVQKPESPLLRCFKYFGAFTFVAAAGLLAWQLHGEDDSPKDVFEWRSQALGWTSAILYIASRIPQIYKNFETRCEGLSLALFIFAIIGNVTYVLSICVVSTRWDYLAANAPWLAGCSVTILFDVFVLCQFFYFRSAERVFVTDGQLESEGFDA